MSLKTPVHKGLYVLSQAPYLEQRESMAIIPSQLNTCEEYMTLLTAKEVMRRCGGVSQMSLWRWLQDPETGFPAPRYIKTRRYWRDDELQEWIEKKAH